MMIDFPQICFRHCIALRDRRIRIILSCYDKAIGCERRIIVLKQILE